MVRTDSPRATLLPDPEALSRNNFELLLRRVADDIGFGTDESIFVGSGLEYAQSRPYEPGDSVRQIDWKVTARMPVAYVKQHETLKRMSMYLLVDTSASMQISSTHLSKHALAVWIAGALGLVSIRRLSPVSVLSGGSRFDRIRGDAHPSLSPDDLWRHLEPLRAKQVEETTELTKRIDSLCLKLREKSVIVVISDLFEDGVESALKKVGPKHDVIVLHLVDPSEGGNLSAGYFVGAESESNQQFLVSNRDSWNHHIDLERKLAAADVSYARFVTDQDLVGPLRHFLMTRVSLMRGQR